MNGLIAVTVDGPATFYSASCGCGWTRPETAAIELIELDLLSHFDRQHRAGRAA